MFRFQSTKTYLICISSSISSISMFSSLWDTVAFAINFPKILAQFLFHFIISSLLNSSHPQCLHFTINLSQSFVSPRGIHFSNVINSSIEPFIRNLAKSAMKIARFSRDLVTKIERLRNAASQCRCRPLLRSICTVYFFDCVKLFWGKIPYSFRNNLNKHYCCTSLLMFWYHDAPVPTRWVFCFDDQYFSWHWGFDFYPFLPP